MDDFKNLNILVCDDSITNALMLTKLVEQEVDASVITLTDPRKIAPTLVEQAIDMIILDIEMPHINGLDVLADVRKRYETDQLPVLIITGVTGTEMRNLALARGANDFLNKPFDQIEVVLRVKNLLKIRKSYVLHQQTNQILEQKVRQRTEEIRKAIDDLLCSLAVAGELRDDETGKHVLRVGKYARIIAEGYGLPVELAQMIEKTAPLHDIGKIGVPDCILLKPGKLSDDERKVMNQHAMFGQSLIGSHDSSLIQMAKSIAMHHHERWDGEGYPSHLRGESIPIEGRITAIADVFDALTSKRPYKDAWPVQQAFDYIKQESGRAFDPALVNAFMANMQDIVAVQQNYAD